jgi:hypothetical protein
MSQTLQQLAEQYQVLENSNVTIIQRGQNKEGPFMFSQYDNEYPRPAYRGRINLLGGAQEFQIVKDSQGKKLKIGLKDFSPEVTMRRELSEEVRNPKNEKGFTRHSLISDLRKEMHRTLRPVADYLSVISVPPRADGSGIFDYVSIDTTWLSEIKPDLFDEIANAIKRGKRIVCEGNLAVVSTGELVNGQKIFAWDSGIMMGDYLNVQLPNPDRVVAVKLQTNPARESYQDYRNDPLFNYVPLDPKLTTVQ